MKIALVILIMMLSFLFGNSVADKYKNQYQFSVYLKNFATYFKSNLIMFKTDVVKIIDDYLMVEKNQQVKFNDIFIKENYIYKINETAINNYIIEKEDAFTIYTFLSFLGKNHYEFEDEKVNSFLNFLEIKQKDYLKNIKEKGVLSQKIILSIGLIISILIW